MQQGRSEVTDSGSPAPSLLALFFGFASVSALAFGGVLPWARFVVVGRRGWLTPEAFTDMLAVCQLLPGPNIANMSVAIGAQFRGPLGSLAALTGLMAAPVAIVLALAAIYARFSEIPQVRGALAGMAAAAAGLVVAMALKMAGPLIRRRALAAAPVIAVTFGAVALMRWPLWPVVIVLAPISIWLGVVLSRRERRA
jgi:chromate transporter